MAGGTTPCASPTATATTPSRSWIPLSRYSPPRGPRTGNVSPTFPTRTGEPRIFIQNLSTGERSMVSSFPGLNGAPAWSPDGERLALTLSKDGNPEIYILDLASRRLRRVTLNSSIDTEPAWSPGRKQLWLSLPIAAVGRRSTRSTWRAESRSGSHSKGKYNARSSLLPRREEARLRAPAGARVPSRGAGPR